MKTTTARLPALTATLVALLCVQASLTRAISAEQEEQPTDGLQIDARLTYGPGGGQHSAAVVAGDILWTSVAVSSLATAPNGDMISRSGKPSFCSSRSLALESPRVNSMCPRS